MVINPIDRLRSLRVADVMAREVVEVSACQSMAEAAHKLASGGVSAAPVVNEQGRCAGVLSASDFLLREAAHDLEESGESPQAASELSGGFGKPWHIDSVGDEQVRSHMSPAVQTVADSSPLLDAAAIMNAQHVHRLFVVDEDGRPVGVVSTMDVVAALLNAINEMEINSDSHNT